MGFFSFLKKKQWRCCNCKTANGEHPILEVIEEGWILRCPLCGKYANVSKSPDNCFKCKSLKRGILKYGVVERTGYIFHIARNYGYINYCQSCMLICEGERIFKDEKGYYVKLTTYNASGHEVLAGKQRVTLFPTLSPWEITLE